MLSWRPDPVVQREGRPPVSALSAADLSDRAERCLSASGAREAEEGPVFEPAMQALSAVHENLPAWSVPEGAPLSLLKRAILRVLRPILQRQRLVDVNLTAAVSLLADDVVALRGRVAELEAALDAHDRGEDRR
jgi:hypothetical protein